MLPVVAAMALPCSAVPVVAWALLLLALPGPGHTSQVLILRGSDVGGDDDTKIKTLKMPGQSAHKVRKKQRSTKPHPTKQRSLVRAVRRPAAPKFIDNDYDLAPQELRQQFVKAGEPRLQEQFVEAGPHLHPNGPLFEEPNHRPRDSVPRPRGPNHRNRGTAHRPRDPAHRLRDTRRQRPPSVASSFVESMSAPIGRPRDIVRGQVPEEPSLRSFMTRFRGLVLTGLGSMVPTFSP